MLIRVHLRLNNEARKMLELSNLTNRVKRELGMEVKPKEADKRFEITEEAYEKLKQGALQMGLSVNQFLNLMYVRAAEEFANEVESRK